MTLKHEYARCKKDHNEFNQFSCRSTNDCKLKMAKMKTTKYFQEILKRRWWWFTKSGSIFHFLQFSFEWSVRNSNSIPPRVKMKFLFWRSEREANEIIRCKHNSNYDKEILSPWKKSYFAHQKIFRQNPAQEYAKKKKKCYCEYFFLSNHFSHSSFFHSVSSAFFHQLHPFFSLGFNLTSHTYTHTSCVTELS